MSDCVVLIVDDDDDIRDDLAHLLERHGYRTATAGNGAAALDYLTTAARPCVVLLDLMMPIMDGWALRKEMSKHSALAEIPIILLTGAGDLARDVAALGAVASVTKPFRLTTLLDTIARHCTAARSTPEH